MLCLVLTAGLGLSTILHHLVRTYSVPHPIAVLLYWVGGGAEDVKALRPKCQNMVSNLQ